jgi:hypothetical protein
MSLAPVTVDLDTQRIAVLLKELAPAAGLSVVVVHQFLKADPWFHAASSLIGST